MPGNRRGGMGGGGRYYNHGGYGNQNQRNQNQQYQKMNTPPVHSPKKNPPSGGNNNTPISNVKSEPIRPPSGSPAPPKQPQQQQQQDAKEGDGQKPAEKRFTQRSRLFVGNMPLDMTEEQFKALFSKYGEISETFINSSKGFGFVRLDTRANAEKAKLELDGHMIKNRPLRVRFASHGAALSLKHLSPYVSNELLEQAFTQFGPVERAVVIVDDRGRATGRGIVEFARKSSATKALQQIKDGCFLLTSSPQAIVVKPLEQEDTEDGLTEKNVPKNQQYYQEREAPPRFAQPGTFEYEFSMRWKALDEMERQQQDQLNKTIASAREKLESEMENAIHDHRTMLMKQDLMRRQEELSRLEEQRKREIERRKQLEFAREDQHKKELEAMSKRQEILRAQVEGNYHGGPMPPNEPSGRNPPRPGPGGFGGPPNNAAMQEAIALELMAGGQGGLGPAPSRQARFDPGMGGGRGFNPPPGPPPPFGGNPGPGFGPGPGQRRGFGGPMDFDQNNQKRRRF